MSDQTKILVVRERPWESFINDAMTFGWMIAASVVAGVNAHWGFIVVLAAMWVVFFAGRAKAGFYKRMTPAEAKAWLAQEYPREADKHPGPWGNGETRTMGFASPPRKES